MGLFGSKLPLSFEITHGNIIGLNHELASEQIMCPCLKTINYRNHLLLLDCISPLAIIELSTLKVNWMSLLH